MIIILLQAKYLTRKMAANSVEAMHSIDELFDKIAVGTSLISSLSIFRDVLSV